MADFEMRMNPRKVAELASQASRGAAERVGRAALAKAQRNLRPHNRTGRTSNSLTYRVVEEPRGHSVLVGSDLPHVRFLERGRGPVEASPGKVLRFEINGKVLYRKRVGPAKGIHFLGRALRSLNAQDFAE